ERGRRRDHARPPRPSRRYRHHRAVPAADATSPAARPVGDPRRVQMDARAGRGHRLCVRVRRAARTIELPCLAAAAGPRRPLERRRTVRRPEEGNAMVPEAPMEDGPTGSKPAGEGWFIVNAADAEWVHSEKFGYGAIFDNDTVHFPHYGINVQ